MTNRITGTNSGIDVDTVVKQSLTTQQNKIDKAYQQQMVYQYQQEQLKSIVSDVQDFYDKYLDILSGDSLLKSTAYETVKFTGTDSSGKASTAVSAKGFAGADVTDYKVTVTQLASKANATIQKDSVKVDDEITIKIGDSDSIKITIAEKTDGTNEPDLEKAAKDLNEKLKKSGVNATAKYSKIAGGIVIESGEMGEDASFSLKVGSGTEKAYQGQNAKGVVEKNGKEYQFNEKSNVITVDNVQFTLNSKTEGKDATALVDNGAYSYKDKYTDDNGNSVERVVNGNESTIVITSKDGLTKTTIKEDSKVKTTTTEVKDKESGKISTGTTTWTIDNGELVEPPSETGDTVEHLNYNYEEPKNYTTVDGNVVSVLNDGTKTITSEDGKTVTTTSADDNPIKTESFDSVTLSGETDISELKDTIVNFVNDYNKVMETINEKLWETRDRDYMPLTEAQKEDMSESEITAWEKKAQTGLLRNDSDLRRIQSAMKSAMSSMMSSTGLTLESIGIEPVDNYTTKNGMYKIDEDKLTKALTNNSEEVKDLFTRSAGTEKDSNGNLIDKGGVLTQLQSILKNEFKSSTSSLSKRVGFEGTSTESSNTLSKNILKQKTLVKELQSKYTTKETALYNKYSALEVMLEKLNAQSNSLYSMLGLS